MTTTAWHSPPFDRRLNLDIAHEHARVLDLRNALGLPPEGDRQWSFANFEELHPTFPWVLRAKRFADTRERAPLLGVRRRGPEEWLHVGVWLRQPLDTFIVKAWLRVTKQADDKRPVGLVFNLAGARRGFIIHNGPASRAARFTGECRLDGEVVRFHLERYDDWLQAVANDQWSPVEIDARPNPWPPAWQLERIHRPASILVCLLRRIWAGEPVPPPIAHPEVQDSPHWTERVDGELMIVGTDKQFGAVTSLAHYEIARALKELWDLNILAESVHGRFGWRILRRGPNWDAPVQPV